MITSPDYTIIHDRTLPSQMYYAYEESNFMLRQYGSGRPFTMHVVDNYNVVSEDWLRMGLSIGREIGCVSVDILAAYNP